MAKSLPGPARNTVADALLAIAAVLLFVDSFLPWQSCCPSGRSAWQGDGELAGGVMACLALALVGLEVADMTGRRLPTPLPHGLVLDAILTGTALFGVLKFVLVAARHPAVGTWIGVGLVAAIAAMQARRVLTRGSIRQERVRR